MTRPTNYQEYYKIAQQYCDSVIKSGTHTLANSYENVFVDECNFIVNSGDDPIFEIPFAKKSTGNIGYYQGPTGNVNEGYSSGLDTWGAASGSARLNAFYRFSFDTLDVRRDFLNGMWYYLYDGTLPSAPTIPYTTTSGLSSGQPVVTSRPTVPVPRVSIIRICAMPTCC